jgi:myosin-5
VHLEPALRALLHLEPAPRFQYLGGEETVDEGDAALDDDSQFQRTLLALKSVGIQSEGCQAILSTLAGILHLGNVEVTWGEGVDHVEEAQGLMTDAAAPRCASSLLHVPLQQLESALCRRQIKATAEDVYEVAVSRAQASHARDALAKALYTRLFSWLVVRVNLSLSSVSRNSKSVRKTSVLDIFGFEFFSVNRFEQFCINYANEKLQQYFVNFVFKLEQAEYVAEGIDWHQVDFKDNRQCIALLESKPAGVLAILDEACIAPGSSDPDFVCQVT